MKIVLLNTERRLGIFSCMHVAAQFLDTYFPFHGPVKLTVSDFSDEPFS